MHRMAGLVRLLLQLVEAWVFAAAQLLQSSLKVLLKGAKVGDWADQLGAWILQRALCTPNLQTLRTHGVTKSDSVAQDRRQKKGPHRCMVSMNLKRTFDARNGKGMWMVTSGHALKNQLNCPARVAGQPAAVRAR